MADAVWDNQQHLFAMGSVEDISRLCWRKFLGMWEAGAWYVRCRSRVCVMRSCQQAPLWQQQEQQLVKCVPFMQCVKHYVQRAAVTAAPALAALLVAQKLVFFLMYLHIVCAALAALDEQS